MINKKLLLVSLLAVNSTLVLADNSDKQNKVAESIKNKKQEDLDKLIDLLFNKDLMNKMFTKSFEQISQFMPAKSKAADMVKVMTSKLGDKMSSPSFKKQFVKIYDENFTAEEISDLLSFYNSKTGKRFIEKTPDVTSESAKISNDMMQEILAEFITKLQENEEADKEACDKTGCDDDCDNN